MYTQRALDAAAAGNWKLVYDYFDTGTIQINERHATHEKGWTLLDYAKADEAGYYFARDIEYRGGKTAVLLDEEAANTSIIYMPIPQKPLVFAFLDDQYDLEEFSKTLAQQSNEPKTLAHFPKALKDITNIQHTNRQLKNTK